VSNVVSFPPPLSDVPGHLRALAARIEGGEYGGPVVLVALLESPTEYIPFVYGECEDVRGIGLATVLQKLLADLVVDD